jgi:hypothetical protein
MFPVMIPDLPKAPPRHHQADAAAFLCCVAVIAKWSYQPATGVPIPKFACADGRYDANFGIKGTRANL